MWFPCEPKISRKKCICTLMNFRAIDEVFVWLKISRKVLLNASDCIVCLVAVFELERTDHSVNSSMFQIVQKFSSWLQLVAPRISNLKCLLIGIPA